MHPDETAFLKAVAATPDDDLPRLVYADWLDEQGRSVRADFIRSQIELHRLEEWFQGFTTRDERKQHGSEYGKRLSFLKRWVQAFLKDHHVEATGIPDEFRILWDPQIKRGFVSSIIREAARVKDLPGAFAELAGPHVEVAIDFVGYHLSPETDQPLRDPAGWDLVTNIQLYDRYWHVWDLPDVTPPQLARLATVPLDQLEHLNLDSCRLTDEHAQVLASQFDLPALRSLVLSGNPMTVGGIRTLTEARWWGGLRELSLSGLQLGWEVLDVLEAVPMPQMRVLSLQDQRPRAGMRVMLTFRQLLVELFPLAIISC